MGSSATYLTNIKEEFERLKVEQTRMFGLFEEFSSFQVRLAEFGGLTTHEEVYTKLLEILSTTVDFAFARVLRWVEGPCQFRVEYEHGVPEVAPESLQVDDSLLHWAIKKEQVSLYPVEADELRRYASSVIVIPLIGRREILGTAVLWVHSRGEELSRHVFQMLTIFSKEVAAAMENLDLYLRTQNLTLLLDNTIESVPHAIMVFGLDDRIIACNKNAEFLFGFKRFFALEERYQEVLPKDVTTTFSSLILSTLEGRIEIDQEMDYSIDARTRLTLGISSSLLTDKQGKPQGILFICRDMSLSREVEKLRELDSMKTEFVHTVSHELKTPLTAILSGTEILMSEMEGLDDCQKEVIQIIDEASRRLQMLLNDILDLSKLEDGDMRMEMEWTSMEEMVRATATMLVTSSVHHDLKIEAAPDVPQLEIDKGKMTQVLENIIGNAIKYSPEGGTVRVKVYPEDGWVKVDVQDAGVGIPSHELPKIWDKFFRAELASERQIEGTGLGLSIAKHIMELHGGELSAQSEEGVGTTFTISLPAKTPGGA